MGKYDLTSNWYQTYAKSEHDNYVNCTISSSTFSRSSASRASIKLSAGLKISPLPEKHQKRPEIILPRANDYRVVAIAFQHPLRLENVEQTKPLKSSKLSSNSVKGVKATSKLYAPSLGVAETTGKYYRCI